MSGGDPRPSRRLGMALALLLGLLPGLGRAQPAERETWERLPDGRVVIDTYGRRFAFPPSLIGSIWFRNGPRKAPLAEVIAAGPAEMHRWWAAAHPTMPVGIHLHPRLIEPLLFGGDAPLDRAAVQPGPEIEIWIYQDRARTWCRQPPTDFQRQICDYFLERSRDVSAVGPQGTITTNPPMLRGTGRTYYVFPESDRRAVPGDPAEIGCVSLSPGSTWCQNGSPYSSGYFLRPGIYLRYDFSMRLANPPNFRVIDDAMRRIPEELLLEPAPRGN